MLPQYLNPPNPSVNQDNHPSGNAFDDGNHVAGATQNINPFKVSNRATGGASYSVWYHYGQSTVADPLAEANGYTPNVGIAYAKPLGYDVLAYNGNNFDKAIYSSDVSANPRTVVLTFTPDAGYSTRVNAFDFIMYNDGATVLSSDLKWTLFEGVLGGTVIAASDSSGQGQTSGPAQQFTVTGGLSTALNADLFTTATNAAYYAGPVVLELKTINGVPGTLGFDNFDFTQQVVPEPASLTLIGAVSLLLMRRRRLQSLRA